MMIYLDNAATTYPKPKKVYRALDEANREYAFNAGRGNYPAARKVFDMIETTRDSLASLIHVSKESVCFESSATEALNLIIRGIDFHSSDNVYLSPFEHNAIVRPLFELQKQIGFRIHFIPFDKETWEVNLPLLNDQFVQNPPKAVFLSHISNVTGYILPFEPIFALSRKFDAINVLDCAQSFGIVNPNIKNVDFLVFAGHKSLYASFGIAGFFDLTHCPLNVVKSGGTGSDSLNHDMPLSGHGRYESGSLNSVAVAGLGASVSWLKENPPYTHEKELTEYLISRLAECPNVHSYLPKKTDCIFGIVSFGIDSYLPSDVGTILGEDYSICVRTGYHCSPFVHGFIGSLSHQGTVRASVGAFNTKEDIDALISALQEL